MAVETFVNSELKNFGVEDETLVEYVLRLALEEDMEMEERMDGIRGFLESMDYAYENKQEDVEAKLNGFIETLCKKIEAFELEKKVKQDEEHKKKIAESLESEKQLLKDEEILRDSKSSQQKTLSKEEQKRKAQILAKYAYDLDEVVENENGVMEIHYKDKDRSSNCSLDQKQNGDSLLIKNRNADMAKEAQAAQRLKMQQEHQQKVQRNKEQQEKQKLAKEKETRRTQKKEKRRM